uniref:Thioredoxindependent peroxide reductase putative n=1 Tax=Albugo laibachii Nc14 TaxID=890382 RepID=F0WS23_9STRA|nr:thioredoxindependent peroxide reductase putative [Albugo laibachii Nc14]|eukprot:CCA24141.1 thioredoxindependent peroxide reductase putative [Albugo laibachii Nc14]
MITAALRARIACVPHVSARLTRTTRNSPQMLQLSTHWSKMQTNNFQSNRVIRDEDHENSDFFYEDHDVEHDGEFVQYGSPMASIQEQAPSFTADAVVNGEIASVSLDQYRGQYVVLFFYPKDFTYVCPTEIIAFNDRSKEFKELNTQLLAISTDSAESHLAWTKVPRNKGGLGRMEIPLVSDIRKIISAKYGVLLEKAGIALRGLFIIDKEGTLQQITVNNLPIGRSVDETLRLIQALQFVEEHGEVCPANWKPGSKSIVATPKGSHEYFSGVDDDEDDDSDKGMTLIKSKQQFQDLIKKHENVVAKFMAPWCGKCAKIQPYVQELTADHPKTIFAKLDADIPEIEEIKNEMQVDQFPEFRFFKKGKEVLPAVSGYKKAVLKSAVEKLERQ